MAIVALRMVGDRGTQTLTLPGITGCRDLATAGL